MFEAFIALLLSCCALSGSEKAHYDHAVFSDEARMSAEYQTTSKTQTYDAWKAEYYGALNAAKASAKPGGIGSNIGAH